MAQNPGAGLQLPPPRSAGLAAGLKEVGESAALLRELRGLLKPGDAAEELAGRALEALTRGLSLLHAAAALKAEEGEGDSHLPVQLPPAATSPCYNRAIKERSGMLSSQRRSGVIGVAEKKAGRRRRSQPYLYREAASTTLDDGYTWRKYGQKDIQNSSEPRSYYRCTYKKTRGCQAQRQAQKREDDSGLYTITYFGDHTCDLQPAAAHHRKDQQGQQKLPLGSHLISFTAEDTIAAVSPLPASIPAPCKQEPAAMPSDPAEVVRTCSGNTKPGHEVESDTLPPLCSGFYCGGAVQQDDASPGRSSVASGVSHEDLEYMDGLDLTSLLTLENPDDFSPLCFSF